VTAELVKTAENAYRDVSIAFANELALACEVTGGDFLRVRELVNKSPGRNVLLAGAGVGGHCIPKDSWLLVHGVNGRTPIQLIAAARSVNTFMPYHMVDITRQALQEFDMPLEQASIAVLGMAYLENSDDMRNSPSLTAQAELERLGARVQVHDPYVPEYSGDLWACLHDCDAVLLMVAHDEYRRLDLTQVRAVLRTPILIDGRRVFDPRQAGVSGLTYRAVGWGEPAFQQANRAGE
jgi:UDP-N-acetyl-D-mannosaminuronic acid dehydrogenase